MGIHKYLVILGINPSRLGKMVTEREFYGQVLVNIDPICGQQCLGCIKHGVANLTGRIRRMPLLHQVTGNQQGMAGLCGTCNDLSDFKILNYQLAVTDSELPFYDGCPDYVDKVLVIASLEINHHVTGQVQVLRSQHES